MPELDLGAVRLDTGCFLLRPGHGETFRAGADAAGAGYQHRFSYARSQTGIADTAVDLVRGARHKVFLASFRIGDGPLLEALYEAVDRLRGGVYVITSWNEKSLRRGLGELDDDDLTKDDVKAQNKRFDDMTRRGIAVRGHPECHAKFLVVDDRVALVTSANLETSALRDRTSRSVTVESGALVTDGAETQRLARFFTRLWFAGCTGEARPGDGYVLRDRTPEASPCAAPPAATGPEPSVIWTHHDERGILDAIVDIAGRARHELLLASFSLVGLSERANPLLPAIEDACRRGVRVRLLVRGRNQPGHLRDAAALAALGVELYPDSLTHAKGAVADAAHGALFSANFDLDHGLVNGVEAGIRLDGTPALGEARRFLLHVMRHSDLRYVQSPAHTDLDQAFPARWRRRWPYASRLRVRADDEHWQQLTAAALRPPVLYESGGEDKVTLYAGGQEWTLRRESAHWRLSAVPAATEQGWKLVRSWTERRGERAGIPARGFAAAVLMRS
uniref:Phospholipase D n=1 Tax=uncultured soil bacterium TaxID=164851 RepID=E2D2M7_9BACT|nr:phospholipase D [uncultured soil bacterium]